LRHLLYKKHIQTELDVDMIDKSLNDAIDSDDEDYILQKIRDLPLLLGSHRLSNGITCNKKDSQSTGYDYQLFIHYFLHI